ncbi:MAG: exonuclease domain-containing protein [Candidatus Kapaibacterium sp.]
MIKLQDVSFIVTDVETTGSNAIKNRITEIACVTMRDGEIINEFSTLLNPYQTIPPFVSRMTGITQSMVLSAPDEFEIIDAVKSLFDVNNPVFAAHNVNFDFAFVKSFFKRGFMNFDYPQLCTLKLARKVLPGNLKKNVGDLSAYFGIRMNNRHRALIDARSTAIILSELLYIIRTEHKVNTLQELLQFQNKSVMNYKVPKDICQRFQPDLDNVPFSPGIFKFYDKHDNCIYWDYSFNLNTKLHLFFETGYIASKYLYELSAKIDKIVWEEYDSELSMLLQRNKIINKAQSQTISLFNDSSTNDSCNHDSSFIFMQPQQNHERAVNFYFFCRGTFFNHVILGTKAYTDKVSEILLQMNQTGQDISFDSEDYKVIQKWLQMQNDTGMIIDITDKSMDIILEEIDELVVEWFYSHADEYELR